MRFSIRRYLIWILLLVIATILLFASKFFSKIDDSFFFGGIAAIITIFLSVLTHYRDNDKFFKELFVECNSRYDKLNNFLNNLEGLEDITLEDRQKIIDYLNLCAEEYMWVKKGRIPGNIWTSWKNGIRHHLRNPLINKVYIEEKENSSTSYYGFFDAFEDSKIKI